jgi:hypothetical protein
LDVPIRIRVLPVARLAPPVTPPSRKNEHGHA